MLTALIGPVSSLFSSWMDKKKAEQEGKSAVAKAKAEAEAKVMVSSATSAAASYDNFDDRYLGAKSSDPSADNDGDSLVTGALYFNTSNNVMMVYTGSA